MTAPDVSVVLACSVGADTSAVTDAIAALRDGCAGLTAELIIVAPANAHVPADAAAAFAGTRIERCAAETLIPVQWGIGARLARGRVVAFTTDHMRVSPGWARALTASITGKTAGAGGPVSLTARSDGATAAAYFLRFSAFAPHIVRERTRAADVPGDNAAYARHAIAQYPDLLADGFWEVEFHRRFARDGLTLEMCPEAAAMLVGPVPFGAMIAQRFRHGKEFGETRVAKRGESALRLIAAAPLVPFVLLGRTGRRAFRSSGERGRFTRAVPWLGILAAAWATGEAAGAIHAISSSRTRRDRG